MKTRCRDGRAAWSSLAQRFLRVRPSQALAQRRDDLLEMARRLPEAAQRVWRDHQNRWTHADARLRLLSPLSVLDRGYSITTDAVSGRVIRSVTDVRAGQRLATRVQTGEIQSVVEDAGPPPTISESNEKYQIG
jgi:exodeoxyribonuclease VII large subunit